MSVHKDKKTGKWYYTGKYKDMLGKIHDYKKRGFDRKGDALKAENILKQKIKGGYGRLKMYELIELYNSDISLRGSTLTCYKGIQAKYISPYFSDKYIDGITTMQISRWIKELATTPYDSEGAIFSENYVKSIFKVLSGLFTFAIKHNLLGDKRNPCSGTDPYMDPNKVHIEVTDAELNFWEIDEFNAFISSISDINRRELYYLLFMTGVRIGEAIALQWEHVDFENKTIHIRQAFSSITRHITPPKNKRSNRDISVPNNLMSLIKERYERSLKTDGFNQGYYIFGDITWPSIDIIRRELKKDLSAINVKTITLHGFRHSHASYLLSNPSIPDQLVADRLGNSVNILRSTYAHIYKMHRSNLINYLDQINEML